MELLRTIIILIPYGCSYVIMVWCGAELVVRSGTCCAVLYVVSMLLHSLLHNVICLMSAGTVMLLLWLFLLNEVSFAWYRGGFLVYYISKSMHVACVL
jgi:hypothetical protein